MILTRIYGGLGNQIFQFSASLMLAEKAGIDELKIDANADGNYSEKRDFLLFSLFDENKFQIKIELVKSKLIRLRIPKVLSLRLPKYPFVGDSNFEYILKNPNNKINILDGYFQDNILQTNFENISKTLKNYLHKSYLNIDQIDNCIIHIRGGDFVKLGWNSVSPREYYINAIEKFKERGITDYIVITDDVKYATEIMNNATVNYSFHSSTQMDDFKKIMQGKYRILSSSTFAFWASTLGINPPNGLVIAPKLWTPTRIRKIKLPNELE